MNNARDRSIDVAKAIAIASVVAGHVLEARVLENGGTVETVLYRWIYAFHMPFWFLLSGYLYQPGQAPAAFLQKKFNHLALPYIGWLVAFNAMAIAGFAINLARGMTAEKWQFYGDHFYNQAYGGELVGGAQMVLWFPACLFFTQQLGNLLYHLVPSHYALWTAGTTFFAFAYVNQFFAPDFRLPLALNVVAGALPFFMLGNAIRRGRSRQLNIVSMSMMTLVILGIALFQLPLHYHMRMAEYGWPLLSTFGAIGAFLSLLWTCRLLTNIHWIVKFAVPVGGASMTIMYFHVVVLQRMAYADVTAWPLLVIGGIAIPTALHLILASTATRWAHAHRPNREGLR